MLNTETRKNLSLLADFLEENIREEDFCMSFYRSERNGAIGSFFTTRDCSPKGDPLGWAPFMGHIHEKFRMTHEEKSVYYSSSVSWTCYSKRLFPSMSDGPYGYNSYWYFAFGGEHYYHDNSLEGAIARLRVLVKNPELFE